MSRKLDALVAEKVMGWRWVQAPKYDYDGPLPQQGLVLVRPDHDDAAYQWPPKGVIHPHAFVVRFKFSTDIAAAWAVVEKMKTDNWRVSVEDFGNRYRINFSKGSQWQAFNSVEHINVPLGICVAALRAVGVDEATIQEAMK